MCTNNWGDGFSYERTSELPFWPPTLSFVAISSFPPSLSLLVVSSISAVNVSVNLYFNMIDSVSYFASMFVSHLKILFVSRKFFFLRYSVVGSNFVYDVRFFLLL